MIPCQFIDEVKSEDVQVLAGLLKAQGLSPASVFSYLSLLKTFFNWLIEDAEVLEKTLSVRLRNHLDHLR